MTEEEKITAETAEAEATTTADVESTEETTTQEVDKGIDYEAEAKKEREGREKAEAALAKDRYKRSEEKRETEEDSSEEDEKPLTKKELRDMLANERQENRKTIQESQIKSIAQKLGGSDAESNLIIEIHKNRTFPSHLSLEEQLEESYVIANRKKIIGERNEAIRALKGKGGVNKDAATAHQGARTVAGPKLPPQEIQAYQAVGYVLNKQTGNFEKKMPSGDTLVLDSKTKKTQLIRKAK